MFHDYTSEVLQCYKQKKANGELTANLVNPTPSSLRSECLMLFKDECDRNDLRTLCTFLEQPQNQSIHERSIRKVDISKFKPLINFLNGKTTQTADKNVELLASLIDFRPRPYANNKLNAIKQINILPNNEADELSSFFLSGRKESGEPAGTQWSNPMDYHKMQFEFETAFSELGIDGPYDGRHNNKDISEVSKLRMQPPNVSAMPTKVVVLEYPSGVKLSVDATDTELIARLVRL